ncbi:MAG: DUF3786 domain-containing protein [Deltaproteobacteria bacterium]|jgi:hypothetical protein|nr:DUF3786 domain-containing protein [Deltaproteobacteria bacterium]
MKEEALNPPGYEKNYKLLRPRLKEADFGARALELGFSPVPGGATIDFLGQGYLLDPEGVRSLDQRPTAAINRSLLIHYILSKGQGGPGQKFLSLWQTPGFLRGQHRVGADLLAKPILEAFGSDLAAFDAASQILGGQCLEPEPDGWRRSLFRVLPRISLMVGLSPADEEFEAEARILCDDLAPSYLDFECLAFLMSVLGRALGQVAS